MHCPMHEDLSIHLSCQSVFNCIQRTALIIFLDTPFLLTVSDRCNPAFHSSPYHGRNLGLGNPAIHPTSGQQLGQFDCCHLTQTYFEGAGAASVTTATSFVYCIS